MKTTRKAILEQQAINREIAAKENKMKTNKPTTTNCILCNGHFEGHGHNPEPLASHPFRCCDVCNETQVIPFRIYKHNYLLRIIQNGGFINQNQK